MYKIFWHEEQEKVVSQLDTIGVFILIAFIIIEVGKNWVFGHWLEGTELNTFGLIFITGVLQGRLLAMLFTIRKVLESMKRS